MEVVPTSKPRVAPHLIRAVSSGSSIDIRMGSGSQIFAAEAKETPLKRGLSVVQEEAKTTKITSNTLNDL